jgi:hypothetical protein
LQEENQHIQEENREYQKQIQQSNGTEGKLENQISQLEKEKRK